ncbi:MAG: hypothetical protein KatS3mg081_2115 [Gemmatimonadales bacterium]|nr:MAG: hypothetical protein KatS3mg081_2115 [Gemmatimonadales bacterium]
MLRVGRVGRNSRVGPRRLQAEWCVNRIVEGVNDVVGGSGMIRVRLEHLLGYGGGAHICRDVTHSLAQSQQGESV